MLTPSWAARIRPTCKSCCGLCGEAGIPFNREVDYGGPFGKTKEPAYLAKNPDRPLVPTIDDDGFVLWESNAIMRYLATKHGAEKLYPSEAQAPRRRGALARLVTRYRQARRSRRCFSASTARPSRSATRRRSRPAA